MAPGRQDAGQVLGVPPRHAGDPGQANEASALRVAEKVGLDMTKLKKDMASAEVAKEIDDTRALADKLGVQGTPYFMVADRIIPGAPENLLERMTKLVAEVRKEGAARSAEV